MGGSSSSPPPPPPPPPDPSRVYNTYTCPEGSIRAFAANTEIRTDWACGSGCKYGNAVNTGCSCACTTQDDIDAAALAEAQQAAADAANAAKTAATARAQAEDAANRADENAATTAATNARNAANSAKAASDKCFQAVLRIKGARSGSGNASFQQAAAASQAAEADAVAAEAARVRAAAAAKAARDAAAAAAAAAAKAAADAAARAKAKADAKAAWDAAQATANAALAVWQKQQADYTNAANAVPPLKLVYDNAQAAADAATAKKAAYDDAVAQQTAANALLKTATDALAKADSSTRNNLDKSFTADSDFMKNAAIFPNANNPATKAPNATFGTDKEYNAMSVDWAAYNAAKTAASSVDPTKLSDLATATDKLIEAYNKFNASKLAYGNAVIAAVKASTVDSNYVSSNQTIATTFALAEYKPMADAWAAVTNALNNSDASAVILNYNAYVPKKTAYLNALLIAQDKKAEADFEMNLAAGKDAAAKWASSAAKGCRNIQTNASTDDNMLDQDIVCHEDEFISGYKKVSGFEAAPADPKVSRDNIAKYLAVKYSCCAAPAGAKGPQGKKGLPGLEGAMGVNGLQGPPGILGPQGEKGEKGDAGPEGIKGPKGESGDDGEDGAMGPQGRAGKSMKVPEMRYVMGPEGPAGKMGPEGPRGPKGKDGIIKEAPVLPFNELDRTIALFDVQNKINTYLRG